MRLAVTKIKLVPFWNRSQFIVFKKSAQVMPMVSFRICFVDSAAKTAFMTCVCSMSQLSSPTAHDCISAGAEPTTAGPLAVPVCGTAGCWLCKGFVECAFSKLLSGEAQDEDIDMAPEIKSALKERLDGSL